MFGGADTDLHLSKDSSKETISELRGAHDEICEMLVAAGYFRARIPALPPFDKMLGGLAWCLMASNVDVDVDLHFDEEMTLGHKIKLGENIVAALSKVRCPSPLQTHQIRGLDFKSMFPVFQWLVKQVISTREERGAQIRRFSELQFNRHHVTPEDAEFKQRKQTSVPFLNEVLAHYKPARHFRRSDERTLDEVAHVQCVLLEYGRDVKTSRGDDKASGKKGSGASSMKGGPGDSGSAVGGSAGGSSGSTGGDGDGGGDTSGPGGSGRGAAAEEEERRIKAMMASMSSVQSDKGVSGSKLGNLVGMQADEIRKAAAEYEEHVRMTGTTETSGPGEARGALEAHKREMAALQRQVKILKTKYLQAKAAKGETAEQAATLTAALQKKLAQSERIQAEIEKLKAMETPENAKDLEKLMKLVTLNDNLKQQEEQFKQNCKRQMVDLQGKIAELEAAPLPEDEMQRLLRVEELYASETVKLQKLRQLLAKKTQEAQRIKRKIDEIPTSTELVQYERRFVELYEQVAAKLEETRRYYAKYNSLTDTKKYLVKEISVLNSIFENYTKSMTSEPGRERFVDSIENIKKGVTDSLAKLESKLGDEKNTRDELNDSHNKLMEKQRLYFKAVKEFQEHGLYASENVTADIDNTAQECTKNEKLTSMLAA